MQDDYIINKVKIHKKLSGKITKMQISDVKDKKRTHAYTTPPNTHTYTLIKEDVFVVVI